MVGTTVVWVRTQNPRPREKIGQGRTYNEPEEVKFFARYPKTRL